MSELSLSQDIIISSDTFNHVVKELGHEGNELLAAVQEDETVFCTLDVPFEMNPEFVSRSITPYKIIPNLSIPTYCYSRCNSCVEYIKREVLEENENATNEANEYNEDQKNILPWYPPQQYEYNDQQVMFATPLPPTIPQIPANVDYAGSLDFDIVISSQTANRNSWIYSAALRKVFINMQNVLPIDVKRNPTNVDLYIRATLLYSLPQYAQELVERCSTHTDLKIMHNRESPDIVKHVLRCTNPGAVYMGDIDKKQHLSVLTPLGQPQAGMDTVRINYQFMCKNSCPSGMNRRAVDVIFTLEDGCGNVLGRRKLSVRVCSCPKRDKEKEEKEYIESATQQPTCGRKRKHTLISKVKAIENGGAIDDNIYEIPAMKVVGVDVAETMLKAGRDRLCFNIHCSTVDEAKAVKARECLETINNLIKNLQHE